MITALALWRRLPVVVRAVVSGWLVTTVGTGLWVLLSLANQKYFRALPWALLPTAGYLWLFWRYLRGDGWPRASVGRPAREPAGERFVARGVNCRDWLGVARPHLGARRATGVEPVGAAAAADRSRYVTDTGSDAGRAAVHGGNRRRRRRGSGFPRLHAGTDRTASRSDHGDSDYRSDVRVRSFCSPGGDARPDAVALCGGRGGLRRPGLHHELDSAQPGAPLRRQYVRVSRPVRRR